MKQNYYDKYVGSGEGIITDLGSLPSEAILYLKACQLQIKHDIDFVSNYEEIYNFRPEFTISFLSTINKTAFTCADDTYTKCFIGISIGLIFTLHNILCEALLSEPKFLNTYFF